MAGGDVGIIAPAQFEAVASSLDRYGLEPVCPRAFGLGQHQMIEINLIPVLWAVPGRWRPKGSRPCLSCLAWPEAFPDLPLSALGLGPG